MTAEIDGARRRRGWSVRSRILASILVVAALGLAGAGATTFLVQRDRILHQIDDRLRAHVESARSVLQGPGSKSTGSTTVRAGAGSVPFTTTDEALEAVIARVLPTGDETSLGLINGRPAYVPAVNIDCHIEDDPALVARIVAEVSDGSVRLGTVISPLGNLRYIAAPLTVKGSANSGIYVAAVDLDGELAQLTGSFVTFAGVALAALAAIGLVGWFVAGRLLRPIRQLRMTTSRITASERHERIPVAGRDDVSDLTATINDMLDRLDLAMTGQRQLLDDVRHELKTPITIVRGHLELLDDSNPAEVRATRALALDELDRMAGLIDDIESLAETSSASAARRPTDVADLTADVFAKAAGLPDHQWILAESAQRTLPLDSTRITQAWLQLVDNAAKYSPAGTKIVLGSTESLESTEFWVADTGPGIPPGSEERIFERFGRVDTGRGIRGSGLGLPIVKAIALAHGGRVSLVSSPLGSRFGIVIPHVDAEPTGEVDAP
ncbi:MAG: signal transduction histidine kinase [Glaciihabitans sp.]|nr:signal transduction histidine kinase [Glaciihabitans sp.]